MYFLAKELVCSSRFRVLNVNSRFERGKQNHKNEVEITGHHGNKQTFRKHVESKNILILMMNEKWSITEKAEAWI